MHHENSEDQIKHELKRLNSLDGGDQFSAAQELAKMGAVAVEPLIKELTTTSKDQIRQDVAWALGEIGDPRAIEPLISLLEYIPLPAAEALARIKDARVVERLMDVLKTSESMFERYGAAYGLGLTGSLLASDALLAALADDDVWVRAEAALALGSLGSVQFADTLFDLAATSESGLVRNFAAWGLALLEDRRAIEPLIAGLLIDPDTDEENTNVGLRYSWAEALVKLDPASAVKLALDTPDISLQSYLLSAFEAVGKGDVQSIALKAREDRSRESHVQILKDIQKQIMGSD